MHAQHDARDPSELDLIVIGHRPALPVFVDDSGRRHRITRVVGGLVALATAGLLVVSGIAVSGSPEVHPPSIAHATAVVRLASSHASFHSW